MNSDKNRLPDGELEVMQALWDCEIPASRADIEARLHTSKPIAATTLLTFLSRLTDKGYVRAEKSGRSAMYTPLVSREEYLAGQSRRFLDKLCGGKLSVLAAALCDSGLSRDEIEELRGLLERNEL